MNKVVGHDLWVGQEGGRPRDPLACSLHTRTADFSGHGQEARSPTAFKVQALTRLTWVSSLPLPPPTTSQRPCNSPAHTHNRAWHLALGTREAENRPSRAAMQSDSLCVC